MGKTSKENSSRVLVSTTELLTMIHWARKKGKTHQCEQRTDDEESLRSWLAYSLIYETLVLPQAIVPAYERLTGEFYGTPD